MVSGIVVLVGPIVHSRITMPSPDLPIAGPTNVTKILPNQTLSPTSTELLTSKINESIPLYWVKPDLDEKIGTITLPTLDLSWPIFEGTTDIQLAKGVGHYSDAVLPGMIDNSVLSGHRSTVFNRLVELEKGDLIYVQTLAGTFTYEVQGFRIVKRTDRTVIVSTKTAILTLTTCYPFNFLGKTTEAYIVTAGLINSEIT
jgi:sortase A